jgi:hypothetical protein
MDIRQKEFNKLYHTQCGEGVFRGHDLAVLLHRQVSIEMPGGTSLLRFLKASHSPQSSDALKSGACRTRPQCTGTLFVINKYFRFQNTNSIHWVIDGPWSATVRPELYWDRNGRLTGSEQFIKAVTTTLEYKFAYLWTNTIARLEYRYDESRVAGGGFDKGGEIAPGVIGLTPAQHLLIVGLIWTFDPP